MKKIFNILLIAITATGLVSCKKFLDQPSDTKADSETIFDNSTRAEAAVVGCYSQTFNREFYYQLGMGTDECFSTEGETNSKNQVANYVYTTSNTPTSTYTAMYTGIEYANVAIKGLQTLKPVSPADEIKINMLLGESYAIRAMNYINLIRFFGDVPYSTESVAQSGIFTSSRVSRDTIYDGCIRDLQKAITLLPWKSAGLVPTPERFTKNSAYGILARTALYAAGFSLRWDLNTYAESSVKIAQRSDPARIKELYKIAADACKAVIDQNENSLLPSYANVFRDLISGRYNSETMLEYGQYGPDNGSAAGYTNGSFIHTSSVFGKSQPAMAALPTYYFDFDQGDVRRDVTICNYGIGADNKKLINSYSSNTIGKFRGNWGTEIGTAINKRDINWPVLRYSDVLLMYAEALNEYNQDPKTGDAIKYFKEVRVRGFGGDATKIGTIPTDYSGFRNAIIKERELELGFESWRRTDLERWGILFERLTETKQNLIDMANTTGKYANIDKYAVYKPVASTTFEDPTVAVAFTGYKTMTPTDSTNFVANGFTVLRFHGASPLNSQGVLTATSTLVTGLFRGLEKNKVEILPLATSIIDVNPGLQGQQQPKY